MTRKLTIRHPKPEDAQAVCELVIACDIEDFGEPDFDLGALKEMWASFDLENNVWVIEDERKAIVGYGFLEEEGTVKLTSIGWVLPTERGNGVGSLLLESIEKRAKMLSKNSMTAKRLQNIIPTKSEEANALLKYMGFKPVRFFKRMVIKMECASKIPQTLDGFVIEPFVPNRDEHDVYDTYLETFVDHWDYVVPPYDEWVQKTKRSTFTPEWWFVVRNQHHKSELAGIALCTLHDDTLFVNQIGIKSKYRRKGLGLSLLQWVFYQAYNEGQPIISLGVDSESPTGAHRLYEKAGMVATQELTFFEKMILIGE